MAAPPAANIKFEDGLHKVRSDATTATTHGDDRIGGLAGAIASGSSVAGGIYHARSRSRAPSLRRRSAERRPEAVDVEEGDSWQRDDYRRKQVFRGKTLFWLAYQSIGVIYGDIGTSPLYVYSSTFTSTPDQKDVTEVLSIIIWALTLMVTVKYVFIILRADNEGEGGTFSCYSLLTRFANISDRDPRENQTVRMERYSTGDVRPTTRAVRKTLEQSIFFRGLLKTIGILAVSMVMADGVLTPAQSVLGAVQGLTVVKPDISNATVVGTSCGILLLLFVIQPFGTTKLATTFAPVVILWLGFNGAFGIYNLVKFDWTVLKAFSPVFAFRFMIERKTEGWKMLGGILLAFTGVEALFADLGAFSMRAIQLSWLFWAYPCLLLAYIGQAAYISVNPDAWTNPFFNSVPPGMLYPSLIVAVLAAIVASQAIITATFQLTSQIMKLSYCPQVKIVHTSKIFHGQLYVPFLNWLLMLGTILVTAIYNNTTSLGAAYGVCVMFVTFFDTCMVTLVSLIVWKFPVWVVFLPWLAQSCLDGLFLSSALNKVPDGAWFTLTLSCILALLFLLWRYGKETQWRAEAEDRFQTSTLVRMDEEGRVHLTPRWGGDSLSPLRAVGIYFDKTGVLTPSVFTHFVAKLGALPDVSIFFHLHPVETPTVGPEERFAVSRLTSIPGTYRLVIRHGFMDEVVSPDLGALIYEQIRKFIIRQAAAKQAGVPVAASSRDINANNSEQQSTEAKSEETPVSVDPTERLEPIELRDEKVREELARLDRAYAAKVLYVVGKEQMKVKTSHSLWRRAVLSTFLWIRDNTRAKIQNLRLAMDRVVEVGFVKDI